MRGMRGWAWRLQELGIFIPGRSAATPLISSTADEPEACCLLQGCEGHAPHHRSPAIYCTVVLVALYTSVPSTVLYIEHFRISGGEDLRYLSLGG